MPKKVTWSTSVLEKTQRRMVQRRSAFFDDVSTVAFAAETFGLSREFVRAVQTHLVRGSPTDLRILPLSFPCDPRTLPATEQRPYWLSGRTPHTLYCVAFVTSEALVGLYECKNERGGVRATRFCDGAVVQLMHAVRTRSGIGGHSTLLPSGVEIKQLRFVK